MSKKKKDILNSFGEKMGNQKFDFDAAHWDSMQNMIVADEKKKQKGFILLWSSIIFFGSLIMLTLFHQLSGAKGNKELTLNKVENSLNEDKTDVECENNDKKLVRERGKITCVDDENKLMSIENNPLNEEYKSSTVLNKHLIHEKRKDNNLIVTQSKTTFQLKRRNHKLLVNNNLDSVNNNKANNSIKNELISHSKDILIKLGGETGNLNSLSINTLNNLAKKNKDIVKETTLDTSLKNINSDSGNKRKLDSNSIGKINLSSLLSNNLELQNTSSDEGRRSNNADLSRGNKESNQIVTDVEFANTHLKKEINKTLLDSILNDTLLIDSIQESNDTLQVSDSLKKENKEETILLTRLLVYGGLNYYKPYANTEDNLSKYSIDPNLGIAITKDWSPKIGSSIGLRYSQKSKINSQKEFETITYGFGKDRDLTTILTSKIYFAGIELGGYYSINKRLKLNALFGIMKLLNSKSEVTILSETSFAAATSSTKTEFGFYNGYRDLSFYLNTGMQYYLSKRWSAELNYNFGFTDITLNEYFRNSSFDRNSGIQLNLKYDIVQLKK